MRGTALPVVEELLTEAHELPESPWLTSAFFAGFPAYLLIELLAADGSGGHLMVNTK